MKSCGTLPDGFFESGKRWARLVGAFRVHLHQHCAHHPLKSRRRPHECPWHRREELPETEAARHRVLGEGCERRTVAGGAADRARQTARGPHGFSIIDLVFSCATLGVVCAVAIPQTLASIDRSRGLAAARYLAGRMALARAQAVSRSTTIALRFIDSPNGISISVVQDGNRNGVRTRDIDLQIDRSIEAALTLSDLFPGVEIGLTPQLPGSDPVQLGSSNILSFTSHGTASSGSVYVRGRDGTQWVVRVLGATARARVLRYIPSSGEWVYAS